MALSAVPSVGRVVGRYALFDEIGAGGMASVLLGRLRSEGGFSKTVAVKRLHAHLAKDPAFRAMLLDEARMAARVRHPNVVQTLDVVAAPGELLVVMEYVHGESLARLGERTRERGETLSPSMAVTILSGVLLGLDAAHEATSESGEPLALVHRDVSPQNILVGIDGIPRVLDFGIAKALGRTQTTREGQVKGKLAYMAPEQVRGGELSRRTDVFAAAVVLWGALTGRKLFDADSEAELLLDVLEAPLEPPSAYAAGISPELDAIVMRGLARDPAERFGSAKEMARSLEQTIPPLPQREVGDWVARVARDELEARQRLIVAIERLEWTATDLASGAGSALASVAASALEAGSVPASDAKPIVAATAPSGRARRPVPASLAALGGALLVAGAYLAYRAFRPTEPIGLAVEHASPEPSTAPSTSAAPTPTASERIDEAPTSRVSEAEPPLPVPPRPKAPVPAARGSALPAPPSAAPAPSPPLYGRK